MSTKTCRTCREEKGLDDFSPRSPSKGPCYADGRDTQCKACKAVDMLARYNADIVVGRAKNRASRDRNKDKRNAKVREWNATHKEWKSDYDRGYRANNVSTIKARLKDWSVLNRELNNEKLNNRRRSDPQVRMAHNIGVSMRNALHGRKDAPWREIVGYGAQDLVEHLAALFTPEMSWANYATYWQVEHERPIWTFTLPEQAKECWSLSNLRPMEKGENYRKGGIWQGVDPRAKPKPRRK